MKFKCSHFFFLLKLIGFSFFLLLLSCSNTAEKPEVFTARTTAPLIVMEHLVIEKGNAVKEVFGEITVKPDNKNEYFKLKKGDELKLSDIIYMSEGAKMILLLPSGELRVIHKNEVGDAYIVTHQKALIKT